MAHYRVTNWQPPKQGRNLETFIKGVESDITKHESQTPKHDNLKSSEGSALHSLQKRGHNYKTADKGSAIVVMDREHYVSEAERQLNDSIFYKALDHDLTHEFAKNVADAICEIRNGDHISESAETKKGIQINLLC